MVIDQVYSMALEVSQMVSVVWRRPLLAGLMVVLFSTPLFHLVLFFSPLLLSTTLCVVALVSVGPQIERIREERERQFKIALLAMRGPEQLNRYLILRPRPPRPPGPPRGVGETWVDWVKRIDIRGQAVLISETHFMNDVEEEGLKAELNRPEEGGLFLSEEDFSFTGALEQGHFVPESRNKLLQALGNSPISVNLKLMELDTSSDNDTTRSSVDNSNMIVAIDNETSLSETSARSTVLCNSNPSGSTSNVATATKETNNLGQCSSAHSSSRTTLGAKLYASKIGIEEQERQSVSILRREAASPPPERSSCFRRFCWRCTGKSEKVE